MRSPGNRAGLLAVSMTLACSLPASASGALLYDQTDFAGSTATVSTDYITAHDSLDTQIADDFTVPDGQSWVISQIDVIGVGSGVPPPSMNVFLYADAGTLPGEELFRQGNIASTNAPNYSIPLGNAPPLQSGAYWVSVQQVGGNIDIGGTTDWSWKSRTVQAGDPAAYRNPGGGYTPGCTDWGFLKPCVGSAVGPDVPFSLSGTVTPLPPAVVGAPSSQGATGPSNQFRFGKVVRNKRRGTLRLTVVLPGAGMLQLAGQRAPRAVRTGAVKLLIRAKGRAKAKLDRTGRVKVKAIVTFTPTGGSPRTQTKRVKLEKTILHRQKRTTR